MSLALQAACAGWRAQDLDLWLNPEARACFEASRSLVRHLRRVGFDVSYLALYGLTDPIHVLRDGCSYFESGRVLKEEYLFSTIQHVCLAVDGLAIDPTAAQFDPGTRGIVIEPLAHRLAGWQHHRICRTPATVERFWARHA